MRLESDLPPRWRRLRRNKRPRITTTDAHTTRFPAPHPLGEEHPADYPSDEICRGGKVAARAGIGAGGAPVCTGAGAGAAFDNVAYRGAATSIAGRSPGRKNSGDR